MNESTKKTVLVDHKQVGKKFIPPLKQLPNMNEVSYVNDLLPNLIWFGLINERLGYHKGMRLLKDIIESLPTDKARLQYAFASEYQNLTPKEKMHIVQRLEYFGKLEIVRECLAPLVMLYDDFPMRFFGKSKRHFSKSELVNLMHSAVKNTINKYETGGIMLHSSIIVAGLFTGTMRFTSKAQFPDINVIVEKPDSPEARRVAGSVRALAMAFHAADTLSNQWAKSFWNKNMTLSKCKYNE